MIRYSENKERAPLTKKTAEGILIHKEAEDMPNLPVARFARMPGERQIFAFACGHPSKGAPGAVFVSYDGGSIWSGVEAFTKFAKEGNLIPTDSGAFMCTAKGTLIAAFSNMAERVREDWDPKLKDSPGVVLPVYAVRSSDGGRTWQDLQKLHREWTGANRDVIQTRDGRVVFTTQKLLHKPGRHAVLTYGSDDEGKSWEPSNGIDLGGNGHHDGVCESTLIELKDGRLLKYIRTNWGQFWRAFSTDGGRFWHPHGPAGIDASSAPGALLRLASGRITLAWNRYFPEGEKTVALRGGECIWSATPTSNFREELSISFSEDECETWSPPIVIARNKGSEVSYPHLFEPEPGTIWITAHRWNLKMMLPEEAVLY